eukprot:jgi/Botrbrau1/11049/Bobra.92_2s0020.1
MMGGVIWIGSHAPWNQLTVVDSSSLDATFYWKGRPLKAIFCATGGSCSSFPCLEYLPMSSFSATCN